MQFQLVPFRANPLPALIGNVQRSNSVLKLNYLDIPTDSIRWPTRLLQPLRQDGLWQSTCFECFVGSDEQDSYLEINVAPSGHWQAYYFANYRDSRQVFEAVSVQLKAENCHAISFEVDIRHPEFVTKTWKISPSAVIEHENAHLDYYAIHHPVEQPDFHLSALRTLRLTKDG